MILDCPHCGEQNTFFECRNYIVCSACGRSHYHITLRFERCTSADLAHVMEKAEQRWLHTAIRARVYRRGDPFTWMPRFMARAVSLAAFWGVNWKERMSR